jgi:hypothetical protein
MDLISKFLNKISHKFSKGYPDMNNEQDISLLENLVNEVLGENIKLSELTVSSKYQSKGVFNPFYIIDPEIDQQVKTLLKDKNISIDNILYKAVEQTKTKPILSLGQQPFELFKDENTSLNTFISIPKNKVTAHYGQKTRKDSTASSNVNEFLSLYFLINPKFSSVEDLKKKDGGTGILTGEGQEVTYSQLVSMLERDESADRDIKIGFNNAKAIKQDLADSSFKNLYWTPRQKPANINPKNPSDVIIQLSDGSFVGYSNKIAAGEDATPKFNTNIIAFFSKLNEEGADEVKTLIDNAWNNAAKKISSSSPNAKKAITKFKIENEDFSETKSREAFANLALEFQKDKLDFFGKDFYYNFRNNLIKSLVDYLNDPQNLKYFLNTVSSYTYGDQIKNETPCPYKLLVGSESKSTIKDVSGNQLLKSVVDVNSTKNLKNINNTYSGDSQTFSINFDIKIGPEIKSVTIPVTVRTRASGGWSGKALYITTPGIKIS